MFYVYADGKSIFNPMDDSLAIFSPKVTLELGKSGSFQFSIPSSNEYYDYLEQIKTDIVVEIDKTEIFRGRILSISRGFNNIKSVYCEGILSYLVDSVQKARRFNGYAKDLYEDIINRHNSMVEPKKRFSIGLGMFDEYLENARVVIPGKKEDGDAYYGENKYAQAIIESIVGEWQTTYDYINTIFLSYLGGYLIARHDSKRDRNYIDYISSERLDDKIAESLSSNIVDHEIEFGVNMLDFSEEKNAEEMFTVLIPLGDGDDTNLTIEKATNKYSDSSIELVKVNGKEIGIADKKARSEYGTIVKTYAFSNVNQANTLFTNGVRYLKLHKNVPVTYTIKAVDLHFVNGTNSQIEIGDTVRINSLPHKISTYLICTRIEYDLANPANTAYTFGNPQQSLTERYKKNKDKTTSSSSKNSASSAKGSGSAAGAARDDAYYGAYNLFAPAKDWIDNHGAYAEYAISWYDEHAGGAVRAYAWVNENGAGAERSINWYNQHAAGAIRAYDWVSQYGAASEKTIDWYDEHAAGAIRAYDWISSYGAGAEKSISWYDENAAGAIRAYDWISSYGAGAEKSISWYDKNAAGAIRAYDWISSYGAGAEKSISWYNNNSAGAVRAYDWVRDHSAGAEKSITWYNENATGIIAAKQWVSANGAKAIDSINWYSKNGGGAVNTTKWVNDHSSGIENSVKWYNNNGSYSLASINQKATDSGSKIDLIATFEGKSGSFSIKSFKNKLTNQIDTQIEAKADSISLRAKDTIVASAKEVTIEAVFTGKETAIFDRTVWFNSQTDHKKGISVSGGNLALQAGVSLNMGTNTINCGNIAVSSGHSITIGVDKVALVKDIPTDYVKTTEFTAAAVQKWINREYLLDTLKGSKDSFNAWFYSKVNDALKDSTVAGSSVRTAFLRGTNYPSSMSDYVKNIIDGKYIQNKAKHTHKVGLGGHTHTFTYKNSDGKDVNSRTGGNSGSLTSDGASWS